VPETYSKNQVEAALTGHGFIVLQETDEFTIYQTNIYPGDDIILDWSRDSCEWIDLERTLEYHGIDPKPIHNYLSKH
jgi:hypothetical protein